MKNEKLIFLSLTLIYALLIYGCGKKEKSKPAPDNNPNQPKTTEPLPDTAAKPKPVQKEPEKIVKKNGITLKLNLTEGFKAQIVTNQRSETISSTEKEKFTTIESTDREYLIEVLRVSPENEMIVKKTFSAVKVSSRQGTGDELKTVLSYDSSKPVSKDNPGSYFMGTVGKSVIIRLNSRGKVLGNVGGGLELANNLVLAMELPIDQAAHARDALLESFRQTPAFLMKYPDKNLKEGDTWTAPYAFTQGTSVQGAVWNWKLNKIDNQLAVITVNTSGLVQSKPEQIDMKIQSSDVNQKTDIKLQLHIPTGLITSADIESKMSGQISTVSESEDNPKTQKIEISNHTTARIETTIINHP